MRHQALLLASLVLGATLAAAAAEPLFVQLTPLQQEDLHNLRRVSAERTIAPFTATALARHSEADVVVRLEGAPAQAFAVLHRSPETVVGVSQETRDTVVLVADPSGKVHAMVRSAESGRVTHAGPTASAGIYAHRQTDPTALPDERTARRLPGGSPNLTRRRASIGNDGVKTLRVGVLHTPEAIAEVPGQTSASIELQVRAAVAEANAVIYPESGVRVKLELCLNTVVERRAFSERRDADLTLGAFSESGTIDTLRRRNGCDTMVLYSSLDALGGNACGVGDMPGNHAVVAGACFVDNYSFVHELGHNLNACHGAPPLPACSGRGRSGYANEAGKFRTIMAYSAMCRSCKRIGRFSSANQTLSWLGAPIGDASHDNAAAMNDQLELIVAY